MDYSWISLPFNYSKISSTNAFVIFVFVILPTGCRPSAVSLTTGRLSICLSINNFALSINKSFGLQIVILGILVMVICTGNELISWFPILVLNKSFLDKTPLKQLTSFTTNKVPTSPRNMAETASYTVSLSLTTTGTD